MEWESEDEEYVAVIAVDEQLNSLASAGNPNQVFAILLVNGKEETFQLDSGSTVNIMADKTVKKLYGENALDDLNKTSVTLVMYKKSEVKPLGKKRFKVLNPKNKKKYSIEFLIVSGACKSILGLRASEHLQLPTIKNRIYLPWTAMLLSGLFKKEDCLSLYKDVFFQQKGNCKDN